MAVVRSVHKRSNTVVVYAQNARKISFEQNVNDLRVAVRSSVMNWSKSLLLARVFMQRTRRVTNAPKSIDVSGVNYGTSLDQRADTINVASE